MTTELAFQLDAADVDGAVVPYLLMAFAPSELTFSVGFAIVFAAVNLIAMVSPSLSSVTPFTVATFAAVPPPVPHVP